MIEVEITGPDGKVRRIAAVLYAALPEDMLEGTSARFVLVCSCGVVHELDGFDDIVQALIEAGRAKAVQADYSAACVARAVPQ